MISGATDAALQWDYQNNHLLVGDNSRIRLGGGNDLQLYHNSTDNNSYIDESGTGNLVIRSDSSINFTNYNNPPVTNFSVNTGTGGVILRHGGGTRVETSTSGVNISGNLSVTGDGTFTGDVIAFASSDENLKKDIKPIENPIAKLLQLSGNTFTWDEDKQHTYMGDDTGVIAQEVEKLGLPDVVATRDDGTKAVRYEKLIPLLIEAIKELNAKVDDLS